MMNEEKDTNLEIVADIVSAYVSNNSVAANDLPSLIANVNEALLQVARGVQEPQAEAPKPAVPIKKSITPDFLICLDDGKRFKSLKRHLRTRYDLSPEAYREKWGLPSDYPMVAPNYAQTRSNLAKQMGLGQGRRQVAAPVEAAPPEPARKRGRKKVEPAAA
jgi:predicted transcriptional regulator